MKDPTGRPAVRALASSRYSRTNRTLLRQALAPFIALGLVSQVATTQAAPDCAALTRARMSIRVTVASADLPNLATTIREVVEDTWKPYGLTFDWLDDGEVSWDHVHVWIAAISDMPTSGRVCSSWVESRTNPGMRRTRW